MVAGDTENTAPVLEGDTHITGDLGTGVKKTRGCPNHCDNAPWDGKRRDLGTRLVHCDNLPKCSCQRVNRI